MRVEKSSIEKDLFVAEFEWLFYRGVYFLDDQAKSCDLI